MNPGQEFKQLYTSVLESIAAGTAEIGEIRAMRADDRQQLDSVVTIFGQIQDRFNLALRDLEDTEWEQFTMAFFGETNAGKSTLIESMRILFNEDERAALLQTNASDLADHKKGTLTGHVERARQGSSVLCTATAAGIAPIREDAAALGLGLQGHPWGRVRRKLWLTGMCPDMQSPRKTGPVSEGRFKSAIPSRPRNAYRTKPRGSAFAVERLQQPAWRVDGQIIGTGEADFTKGNVVYKFAYKGKRYQLIDVPGIEGDEQKYAGMVRQAVRRAHLVFYVNGTNKKPELGTMEKIASYLRQGTQVFPIVNVRGSADAYEFDEDRVSLDQGGARLALDQTVEALKMVLRPGVLMPGQCVQGLLAFSSLAMDKSGRTTIHQSRERDLVVQQRNYLKHFGSPATMRDFSQIQRLADVLDAKQRTFREDIIESNKTKLISLMTGHCHDLQDLLDKHEKFLARVAPEFDKCRHSVQQALQTFERLMDVGRKNIWSGFFRRLREKADEIVEKHYGDNDRIASALKRAVRADQESLDEPLRKLFADHGEALQSDLETAMQRLMEDVQRFKFQRRDGYNVGSARVSYRSTELDMKLGLRECGAIAFNIGSYALTGAAIGSTAMPGLGTAIGAAIGAATGMLVSLGNFFSSRKERIRRAQAKVHQSIDAMYDEVMSALPDQTSALMAAVRDEVTETALLQVNALQESLARPTVVVKTQLAFIKRVLSSLENMPRGTIQAIQY
jgi:uncharacterized membrane protein